ncbi:MAG: hypothetical protein ACYCZF_08975 [Anaerolineae bacterium]
MSNLCPELHQLLSDQPRYRFPFVLTSMPPDGIYVLFEEGETAHGTDRIVRIGTHDSDGRLAARLEELFIRENKDRSVFRKNIGRALLSSMGDPFLKQWDIDRTKKTVRDNPLRQVDPKKLQQTERKVTLRIQGSFSFVVVPTTAGIDRHRLEAGLIALVASCSECRPSTNWLGLQSPSAKIRESGLWQVQHLDDEPVSIETLELLRKLLTK